ncbi:ABC transporter permease [Ornithinimicrobium sp. F0845]|uniref:ABC transporter permease n=1 Tax=Ornithinimicrobium sp. F0845 TaxID=2926412 RepID=UPI001FF13593|nr:ABC transporter permease [Ornithinimicrobium sp. F0845]MCK0113467.1 ABC transporter permease [Ornithinimicrobium sp. F0845]
MPTVVRAGLRRARIELRQQIMTPMALFVLLGPAVMLAVLYWLRDSPLMESALSVGQFLVPAYLAFGIISGGVLGVSGEITTERDDGTLLRAKTVPHAMTGHLFAKFFVSIVTTLLPMTVIIVGASFLVDGVTPTTTWGWIRLLLLSVLTIAAMLPLGAVLGSIFKGPIALLWTTMVIYGLCAVSGLFYPITALPVWLQWIAQVFPVYWLGLGFRSVILPAEAVVLEIGESWRTWETFGMLGLWVVIGLVLAPIALRRMSRRQSGSALASARERVLTRGY